MEEGYGPGLDLGVFSGAETFELVQGWWLALGLGRLLNAGVGDNSRWKRMVQIVK